MNIAWKYYILLHSYTTATMSYTHIQTQINSHNNQNADSIGQVHLRTNISQSSKTFHCVITIKLNHYFCTNFSLNYHVNLQDRKKQVSKIIYLKWVWVCSK